MTPAESALVRPDGALEPGASAACVPWWSFTKTLIAACVLRLAEQGRVALDAPLAGRAYTVRQVLRHRAGIGDYGGIAAYHAAVARRDPPWPEDDLLARVPPDRLLSAPGTVFAYSNVGYLLLRRSIETATGRAFGPALGDLVLARLGLERARVAATPDDMDRTRFPGGHGYHPGWVYHGLVIGPAAEAALALHRLLAGRLLQPASRAALLERVPIGGPVAGRPWRTTGYGLGLMIGTMAPASGGPELAVAGHSAGGPGSVGAVYHAPATGRTAAVFGEGTNEGVPEALACRMLAGS
ncbi:serine hydrolase domain-containing protein [Marinivivus vitaminiproducens]|uniref:serine hydrolase domain-containing protein n=1 Tax=Marinivivus vitaminiproducens TaxID=3035935 RepID=UPI0027A7812F|nr:serine hydrolase [Geminicoccaceae bacterium SCSIO 64248]